ncbi:hypothetical protein FPV67DRAFT_1494550 [Lyophyllum atratum]|nr:hypothetical protein FPV67DRAFT_1494550 [Lyophyllum atratum]
MKVSFEMEISREFEEELGEIRGAGEGYLPPGLVETTQTPENGGETLDKVDPVPGGHNYPSTAPDAAAAPYSLGPPAPAVLGDPLSLSSSVYVEVGSPKWKKAATARLNALLKLMPSLDYMPRLVCVGCTRPGYRKLEFNSNVDAASFVAIWSAGPRPAEYDHVTARVLPC